MTHRIAQLQSATTLAALLAFWALAYWLWPQQPLWALLCLAGPWLLTACLVGVQFALLWVINANDSAPRASAWQHLRAWAGEVWVCWQVFHWRQPFRSQAVPDLLAPSGLRGVVFVHGFFCNRGLWTPWLLRLRTQNRACVAVNLEPAFGSIDGYAAIIERAVQQVTQATGQPPLLVCHSMGGLAARAWAAATPAGAARVHRIVTLGTPHQGTWAATFSHTINGQQMRQRSAWLSHLARTEALETQRKLVCIYSSCDNIVFPVSNATLPTADQQLYPGLGHLELAFAPQVIKTIESYF